VRSLVGSGEEVVPGNEVAAGRRRGEAGEAERRRGIEFPKTLPQALPFVRGEEVAFVDQQKMCGKDLLAHQGEQVLRLLEARGVHDTNVPHQPVERGEDGPGEVPL
jgi:hypothetical protein